MFGITILGGHGGCTIYGYFQTDTINMVTYIAQPPSHITSEFTTQTSVPSPQPMFVPQQYIYQPTPLCSGSNTHAPVHNVTQPAEAPVGASEPTVSTTGASNTSADAQLGGSTAAEGLSSFGLK